MVTPEHKQRNSKHHIEMRNCIFKLSLHLFKKKKKKRETVEQSDFILEFIYFINKSQKLMKK